MANFFYATAEERHDVVAVAFFQPGEELLHFYNYDAIRSEEPDGDDFHDYAGALPDLEITENVAASAPGLQTLPVSPVVPSVATIEIEPVSESEGTAPRARDILPTCTAVAPMTVEEQNLLLHGDKTQKITSGVLKAFVRSIHLITPSIVESSFRLVNTSNGFSQEHLQIRCLDQAGRMKYARENKIKTQMSARERVEAFMRMLTIFATEHSSRHYYCEMRQVATQTMLDEHQTGIDSVFWINMHIDCRSSLSQIAHRSSLIAQRTQHIAHRLLSSYIAYRKAHIAHCTSHIAYRISHIAHRTSLIAHGASHMAHRTSHISHRSSHLQQRQKKQRTHLKYSRQQSALKSQAKTRERSLISNRKHRLRCMADKRMRKTRSGSRHVFLSKRKGTLFIRKLARRKHICRSCCYDRTNGKSILEPRIQGRCRRDGKCRGLGRTEAFGRESSCRTGKTFNRNGREGKALALCRKR
jgi:hypothetical protein